MTIIQPRVVNMFIMKINSNGYIHSPDSSLFLVVYTAIDGYTHSADSSLFLVVYTAIDGYTHSADSSLFLVVYTAIDRDNIYCRSLC